MARSRSLAAVALAAALLGVGAPAATGAAETCDVSGATLTWGFKESFRAYIDGDIANGEWTTADGATYDTPAFGWSGGVGRYDPSTREGYVEFTGAVRFTGHDGLLDTTIANPSIVLQGGSGLLLLDVSGATMEGDAFDQQAVPFVSMPELEVVGDDAVRSVDAGTRLTEDGATAFPNYPAGEAFDRVEVSLPVGEQCPTGVVGDAIEDYSVDHSTTIIYSALAAGVVAAAVVGVVVATRRRRGA